MRTPILTSVLTLLVACGGDPAPATDSSTAGPEAPSSMDSAADAMAADEAPEAAAASAPTGDPLEALEAAIADVAGRSEHTAEKVKVQHILVGVKTSNPRTNAFKYDEPGAMKVAADLYRQIQEGADFNGLVVAGNSDDPGAGIYTMITKGRPNFAQGIYPRGQMAKVFGDVAWRLEVGEVGVGGFHAKNSPFGIHIIKRLE